ncbi:MAG: undecaprenyl/decaprenyl-phosphate alpha-N-acetylglucosaminyl 1-phosphate transferase [Candidatus Levybacteria bacterium]|nr:undecaprenyl/decaprenyl-phosphate alpha-N-acetylglucosaminyl 1-phosphate transferase [Candidatus Levybacteria bacterium]
MESIFYPFLAAFIATILVVPPSLIILKKARLYDDPRRHKHPAIIHKKPVPRGGGIPLFIGIIFAGIFFLPLTKITGALFFAALIALIIGVLDDKFDISPYLRFLANIAVALIIVFFGGVNIAFITNPLGGILNLSPLSTLISLLWLVWVMNMLNWSKGVDGQMPGIVVISAIVIGILSMRFSDFSQETLIATRLSFIIAGASLGFLLFNFYPAKIFPGYGATAVYLLLGAVSIISSAKLATAILVMGVPMVDGVFTIVRRILTGRSPFWHDNKHLHHLLLRLGFKQPAIAVFYWFVSALLGVTSLLLSSRGKLFAIIMLAVVVGGALLFLHFILRRNEKNTF